MKIQNLHSWNVTPKEAIAIQKTLFNKIDLKRGFGRIRLIGGIDASFSKDGSIAYGCLVVLDFGKLEIIEIVRRKTRLRFPYIPTLLSFREAPCVLECLRCCKRNPDLILVDGQGTAHPRNLGLATHIGILVDKPTIGCAKTRLYGEYEEPGPHKGDWSYLVKAKERLGAVLRTRDSVKPIFVSPGHKIDTVSSVDVVMRSLTRYRIPEPIRQAHILCNEYKK